jgi:serine/threonine protein kinase
MDFEKGKNDLFLQEAHGITQLILKGMDKDSKFFHENRSYPLPRFELNQVLLDDKELGIGEFGVVHAVKGFQNVSDSCNCAKCCIPKPKIIAQVQDLASQNSEVNLRENTQIFPSISGNSSSLKRHRKESSVSFSENLVLKIMGGCPGDDESTLSIEDDDNAIDLSLEETGVTTEISLLRGFMSSHHIRQGRPRYATKRIQSDLPKSQLLSAITDLAAEAKFMSSIRHPNICKMRGTISSPGKNDFVIIMDCLVLTLTEKMKEWKEEEENGSKSIIEKLLMHNRNDQYASKLRLKEDRFADKLLAMYDVARALRYLHNHL